MGLTIRSVGTSARLVALCLLWLPVGSAAQGSQAAQTKVIQTKKLSAALTKALESGQLKVIAPVPAATPAATPAETPGAAPVASPTTAASTSVVQATAATFEMPANTLLGTRQPGPPSVISDAAILRSVRQRAGVIASQSNDAETALDLPLVFGVAQSDGSTIDFKPRMYSSGLFFNRDSSQFEGTVLVELRGLQNATRPTALPEPVRLRLLSDARDLRPGDVQLQVGNGDPTLVTLRASTSAESVAVRVYSSIDTSAITLFLLPQPTLIALAPPDEVEGYSIEGRTLSVRLAGPPRRTPVTVAFSGTATFEPSEVVVEPGRTTASTRVSANRLGDYDVTITAPGFQDASAEITAVWPKRSFTAALVGALVGTIFLLLRLPSRTRAAQYVRRAGLAIIGAFILTAAYIGLGVNLLHITVDKPLTSWLAVAAFAALGAVLGGTLTARTPHAH